MEYNQGNVSNHEFDNTYKQRQLFFQQYYKRKDWLVFVTLYRNLSMNKTMKNSILGKCPDTDAQYNNLAVVLLMLFLPW